MLEFIIKLHPEISIKSKSVRKRQTMLLEQNLRTVFKHVDPTIKVSNKFDHLTVKSRLPAADTQQLMVQRLSCIPGIVSFAQIQTLPFRDLHDIFEQVSAVYESQLNHKRFCIRVKRQGVHPFTSLEAERYIGGGLNQRVATAKVDLRQPDLTIKLEIKQEHFLLVTASYQGMGGFPIPSQSDVLSLISGGYDSAVASYLMIRKGLRTHYVFFNLGGAGHETAVKEIAFYLWQKFGVSHRVKFISVDFAPVVTQILQHTEPGLMGVILKRQMLRAASQLAAQLGINALVTGESIGQVASQTISNLAVIDQVVSDLVLRPLIYQDKQEIIDLARQIGVEELARSTPEYCGVISKSPTVNADLASVVAAEASLEPAVLADVVASAKILDIRTVEYQAKQQATSITAEAVLPANAIVLDIRPPEDVESKPLQLNQHQVMALPFYRLGSQFATLDQQQQYFCYCERGVMSRLQVLLLKEQGFTNVGVYRP